MTDSMSIFQQALNFHKNQDFENAKKLYLAALKKNKDDAVSHNNIGLIFFNEKKIKKAIFHLSKAVSLDNKNTTFSSNLVKALEANSEFKKAADQSLLGLKISPNNPQFILSYIINLLKIGKLNEAISFLTTLSNVSIPEILIHAILIVYSSVDPFTHPVLKNSLGAIHRFFSSDNKMQHGDMLNNLRISLNDDCFFLHLLNKLIEIGFYNSTLNILFELLDIVVCKDQEGLRLALIGIGKIREGKHASALSFLISANRLEPNNISYLNELSQAFALTGNYSDALKLVKKYNLKNMVAIYDLLSNHHFKEAWKIYLSGDGHKLRVPPLESYSKKNVCEKSVLLFRDQGIGDELMYLSCLPDLIHDNPKHLFVECSPRLQGYLLRSYPEIDKLISPPPEDRNIADFYYLNDFPKIDEALRTSELPLHYRLSLDDFPKKNQQGYLIPDTQLTEIWRSRLSLLPKKHKIGIAWKGGMNFKRGFTGENRHALKSLFSIENISWVNMQYGDISNDEEFFQTHFNVALHKWNDIDYTNDLEHIGALSSELDLVIQINNTSLHLAGALGNNVWCLLLHGNFDIRWFNARNDSECAWYPSVTLFRQAEGESLSAYIKNLSITLEEWLKFHD